MNSTNDVENLLRKVTPLDVRVELFRKGDFEFICTGKDEDGLVVTHHKQRKALEILTSNEYEEFLYGGAAGGAKSWTGCAWLMFMGLCFPETKYFIARNELKDILDSVMVTWSKVARAYGFTAWKFNAQKNFIQFENGSHINLIEIKYKPSDPMYEDVGSTEYTCGWIEEVGEIDETGADVISSRVGRHMNGKYGIKGTVLYTCNPKKNWAKVNFYDKHLNDTLEDHKAFLQCLVTENPFIEKSYVEKLKRMGQKNKPLYERLFKGNWDYEDNPNALCEYEKIEQIFDNDHLPLTGRRFITADAARRGSDLAVILVWEEWRVIDIQTYEVSKTTEISFCIDLFRRKYRIPKDHVLIDGDGVGGGVVDETGGHGFVNNAKPIKVIDKDNPTLETPQYRNLQVQCLYMLADRVNENGLQIDCDMSKEERYKIFEELDQIESKLTDYGKLDCKPKSEIKKSIGRSPDYRDALMMRIWFDIRPKRRRFMGARPRTTI